MERHIMDLGLALVAAIIVMIIHELPKAIIYYVKYKDEAKGSLKYMLRLYHYIDPIGLIFSVAAYGGFSKPYLYRMKDKKLNQKLGIAGFSSLILTTCIAILVLKYYLGVFYSGGYISYNSSFSRGMLILMYFCFNVAFISIGMLIVNLFPVASFDMGNLVAGRSAAKLLEFLRKDALVKMAVVLCILLGIPGMISQTIVYILL